MNRSIGRDFDISYHTRAIAQCLADIQEHAKSLVQVDYDPFAVLEDAEDQCARMKIELDLI